MSFSDAIGQVDQIVQWEQQLSGSAAPGQTSSTGASTSTSGTGAASATGTSATSSAAFSDALAAAQADTEASAATSLTDPADASDSTDGLADSSALLGGGDSQLLTALQSMGTSGSTDASDPLASLASTDSAGGTSALISALESAQSQGSTSGASGPAGGQATSASDPRIQSMVEEANALVGKPYVWGGGHSGWDPSSGYDCSGFVSAVLHAGGYLSSPQDTTTLPSAAGMESGPGQYVTVYDRDQPGQEGHVIISIDGQFYESGGEQGSWGGGGGVEQISTPSQAYLSTFNVVLHPAGL
ncbi:MAG TPA: hypothetical protein VME01_07050 [Solirubrobacteraceae bacterium]|nr:hypothetical protein [Solirubrobacteraceae bacterium]